VTDLLSRSGGAPASPAGTPPERLPAAGPTTTSAVARATLHRRVRSAAVCLAFVGLTLSQQPGRIVADTKLDLAVDPWGFLGRVLGMWDPQASAGRIQDQTYGYLFPMGPFFALGRLVGLPPWIVQRLWMALLLSVAFLGVLALARRLRIGTPGARLFGALVYALAPRMLGGLGATSVEMLPLALAPWVLLPLVVGARGGSPRRAAALSGLALFCVGGVNATAAAAVLPLPVLWLLTRPAGPRRRRLMGWWAAGVVLATTWWVGPLLLLGRYSPPFLDYIESAGTTTGRTGLLATVRGTSQWMAYLADGSGPLWPTAWALVHDTLPIVATVVLAAGGLIGLARADLRDRGWLILGVLAGVVLVSLGHLGTVQGVLAGPLHAALDGPLAPLRNVHKFDPVLRLPLALGVAHLAGVLGRRAARRPVDRSARAYRLIGRSGLVALVLALVAVAFPAVGGNLAAPAGFTGIPAYWQQTADWLTRSRPSGRALLLPASSFGTYAWGRTGDEPLQPLAGSPWDVRDAVPFTPAAHVRLLDAVEQRLAEGVGSAGLAGYLARAGISHVVVRNDLDAGVAQVARSITVHHALDTSPGLTAVAAFGPLMPAATSVGGLAYDSYLTEPRSAVEIYAVGDPAPQAWTVPLGSAVSVPGGPDALLDLQDRGLLTDRPALAAGPAGAAPGTALVSDADVRRERSFGRIDGATSAGLAADDPLRLAGAARDYGYPGAPDGESVVSYSGGSVAASSSASDAGNLGASHPENQPYAALDGDATTSWRPADRGGTPRPEWWRVTADSPVIAAALTLQLAGPAGTGTVPLTVTTDAGSRTVTVRRTSSPQAVALPPGETRSITLTQPAGVPPLAFAEVRVPGVAVERTVVTPGPATGALAYSFDAAGPAAGGCLRDSLGWARCSPALAHGAEEADGLDRIFSTVGPAAYSMTVSATPRPGAALDRLIAATARPGGPTVTASSSLVPDPRAGAAAAVDRDPTTAWVADPADPRPTLTIHWPAPRRIDSIRVRLAPGTAASAPLTIGLSDGGPVRPMELTADGTARFAPLVTDTLTVSFLVVGRVVSFDPYTRAVGPLGVGVSELDVAGLPVPAPADRAVVGACGAGPQVAVDGRIWPTSYRTTLRGLRELQPVELTLCGAGGPVVPLTPGRHHLVAASTSTLSVQGAGLVRVGAGDPAVLRTPAGVVRWNAEDRLVRVAARASDTLLVVPENVNPGWRATLAGRPLVSRTVDGWQQGYVVPAGAAGTVHLVFAPGRLYRAALAVGAIAVLLLVFLALLPGGSDVPPSTYRRRRAVGPAVSVVTLGLALAVIGGVVGLLALGSVAAVAEAGRRNRFVLLGALAGTAVLTAGGVAVLAGSGAEPGTQALVLVALSAVAVSAIGRGGVAGTRPRHRRSGRSTRT
jgi:arabinofuranan 3-O-arabinosyltransferase